MSHDPAPALPPSNHNGRPDAQRIPHSRGGAGATVLVVDDELSMRALLRRVLEAEGYDVIEAANGAAALGLARSHRPALVTTDLMMPVMNGRELVARLRADAATAAIPIVVVSAEADLAALPVDATITKPYPIRELVEKVGVLLAGVR